MFNDYAVDFSLLAGVEEAEWNRVIHKALPRVDDARHSLVDDPRCNAADPSDHLTLVGLHGSPHSFVPLVLGLRKERGSKMQRIWIHLVTSVIVFQPLIPYNVAPLQDERVALRRGAHMSS